MNANDPKGPRPAEPSEPDEARQRTYSRTIDCSPSEPKHPPTHEVENGRGTGRLRNPPEDH